MARELTILTISGSLRRESHNASLLAAAADVSPADIRVESASLAGVPLFDEDRESVDAGGPVLDQLRSAVEAADAVLFSTPEYNQALPGVTKNAVDWLSRPPRRVLQGKPVAVIGATTGPWGTRYAQADLRHVLTAVGAHVLGQPMLFVPRAGEVFEDGALVDDGVRTQLAAVLVALADLAAMVATARGTASAAA